jgi:glycosyltransferase involved in cell wall biosynthesis
MSKLTVFVGGSVGSDPWSPRTWSGACARLLHALENAHLLDRAQGVSLPRGQDLLLRAKNVHVERSRWRAQYYLDPAYHRALTRAAARSSFGGNALLQIGHMFSLPHAFPGRTCISYHDGNLAEKLKSGFGLQGVPSRRIDAALRYEEEVTGQMSAIFTFSEYLRQSFISDYHVPAERAFCVGAGMNLDQIPEDERIKDYTVPRVLFVGIEFERKGGPLLFQAFRQVRERIPTAELHVVGPHILEKIPAGVVFHGHLSKADPSQRARLGSLFQDASLFVLPSLYEPFGIAPLEAMLYRIPCVVTDGWALRETVQPGVNGALTAKGDVDGLADKMIRLLSDPESLAAMGVRGREMVLREFTWGSVVGRISEALQKVLKNTASDRWDGTVAHSFP